MDATVSCEIKVPDVHGKKKTAQPCAKAIQEVILPTTTSIIGILEQSEGLHPCHLLISYFGVAKQNHCNVPVEYGKSTYNDKESEGLMQ